MLNNLFSIGTTSHKVLVKSFEILTASGGIKRFDTTPTTSIMWKYYIDVCEAIVNENSDAEKLQKDFNAFLYLTGLTAPIYYIDIFKGAESNQKEYAQRVINGWNKAVEVPRWEATSDKDKKVYYGFYKAMANGLVSIEDLEGDPALQSRVFTLIINRDYHEDNATAEAKARNIEYWQRYTGAYEFNGDATEDPIKFSEALEAAVTAYNNAVKLTEEFVKRNKEILDAASYEATEFLAAERQAHFGLGENKDIIRANDREAGRWYEPEEEAEENRLKNGQVKTTNVNEDGSDFFYRWAALLTLPVATKKAVIKTIDNVTVKMEDFKNLPSLFKVLPGVCSEYEFSVELFRRIKNKNIIGSYFRSHLGDFERSEIFVTDTINIMAEMVDDGYVCHEAIYLITQWRANYATIKSFRRSAIITWNAYGQVIPEKCRDIVWRYPGGKKIPWKIIQENPSLENINFSFEESDKYVDYPELLLRYVYRTVGTLHYGDHPYIGNKILKFIQGQPLNKMDYSAPCAIEYSDNEIAVMREQAREIADVLGISFNELNEEAYNHLMV